MLCGAALDELLSREKSLNVGGNGGGAAPSIMGARVLLRSDVRVHVQYLSTSSRYLKSRSHHSGLARDLVIYPGVDVQAWRK